MGCWLESRRKRSKKLERLRLHIDPLWTAAYKTKEKETFLVGITEVRYAINAKGLKDSKEIDGEITSLKYV